MVHFRYELVTNIIKWSVLTALVLIVYVLCNPVLTIVRG